MTPASVLAKQLRVARELFQESERTRALVVHVYHESLRAQLLHVGSSPTRASLLAWARNFRRACIGAQPLVPGAEAMPAVGHLETSACAEALERELEGDLRGAVVSFGCVLAHQHRIEAQGVGDLERGPVPSAEALRAVLGTWIQQGAAWSGPMVARMRDFRARLEAAAPAPGGEDEGGEPR